MYVAQRCHLTMQFNNVYEFRPCYFIITNLVAHAVVPITPLPNVKLFISLSHFPLFGFEIHHILFS